MAGQKTFHLFRYVTGKGNVRTKLGTFPEMTLAAARKLAKQYKSLSTLGKDPKVEKDKEKSKSKTLGETIEEYLKKKMTLNTQNIKDQRKFFRGFYLGETIDADLTKFWQAHREALSLTRYLKDCTSSKPITEDKEKLLSYKVSGTMPKGSCKILAPNVSAKCLDIKIIRYTQVFTGSMPPNSQNNIYGIYELDKVYKYGF